MEEALDELSVRTRDKGGSIYRGMYFRGKRSRLTDPRLIILVHGFNVDLRGAQATYQNFADRLRTQVAPTPLSRYGTLLGFYWPGDHQSRAVSVSTFPARILVAQDAGRLLARFIQKFVRPEQEVYFIAHSLGCRVVLEALFAIADLATNYGIVTQARIRGAFLMAGAVPYKLCEDHQLFQRRDPQLRDWVIHSASDQVLAKAFPGGEWAAGESEGEAIGRHGWPPNRWHRDVLTKLGHGDYWTEWPLVIENVPAMLGSAAPRGISEWPESLRAAVPPSNDLETRSLTERALGSPLQSGWEILIPQT